MPRITDRAGSNSPVKSNRRRSRTARPQPAAGAASSAARAARSLRILVVEDEIVCARTLVSLLKRFGTCRFQPTGEKALAELRTAVAAGQPFDLLCLDVRLPGMSGLDVLKAVRARESEQGIRLGEGVSVIMTTICRDPATVFGAFNSGCEQYLVKPISADAVSRAMVNLGLVGRKRPPRD